VSATLLFVWQAFYYSKVNLVIESFDLTFYCLNCLMFAHSNIELVCNYFNLYTNIIGERAFTCQNYVGITTEAAPR
jgi:hypothetical protein